MVARIKNISGEIITGDTQIMERWREYFQELLGVSEDHEEEEVINEQTQIHVEENRNVQYIRVDDVK